MLPRTHAAVLIAGGREGCALHMLLESHPENFSQKPPPFLGATPERSGGMQGSALNHHATATAAATATTTSAIERPATAPEERGPPGLFPAAGAGGGGGISDAEV